MIRSPILKIALGVIAVGSPAFVPPIPGRDRAGVQVFRTLADADAIMAQAKPGRRAVVIGGGLLGLEAARGLINYGVGVTVVHLMDRLMDQASPEEIARAARQTGCRSVAFTYNDPVIFAEYAIDTAIACRARSNAPPTRRPATRCTFGRRCS